MLYYNGTASIETRSDSESPLRHTILTERQLRRESRRIIVRVRQM